MKARMLPTMPDPFPPAFRTMLDAILRFQHRIAGGQSEVLRARHRALSQSGTFAGHRSYVRGDDLRRIDWNAYARTGSMFIKLLEEDDRRATTVFVDASPSMLCGNPPRLVTALRLAAILGGLALVHLDGVQLRVGAVDQLLQGRGAVADLLQRLAAVRPSVMEPMDSVRALLRAGSPRKVHWISDFATPATTEPVLHLLRRHSRHVTGWLPTLPDDQTAPALGFTSVVDPETLLERRIVINAQMAAAFAAELKVLQRQQTQIFSFARFPLQRVSLPTAEFEVSDWLEAGWSFRR
ncbi:hypothetical protein LBMAG49_14450 [Planctomycetota bacterium]|nr:hypothetical protein LBMAG49_14450 [Planctomycetota bacterium]